MPITIPSPVKRWPGTITIASPLTLPQYAAWYDALDKAIGDNADVTFGQIAADPRLAEKILPGVFACVEKWSLHGDFPVFPDIQNWPGTPAKSSAMLLLVLVTEINKVVAEEDANPPA